MTQGIVEMEVANLLSDFETELRFYPGKGKAIEGDVAPSFKRTLRELQLQLAEGRIQERDLKLRLDRYVYFAGMNGRVPIVNVTVGLTSYYEWKEDKERSSEESLRLQKMGSRQHRDRGYYFARGLGVDVLPLTLEKKVVVGVRRSDDYDGTIHGVAGWLTFTRNISALNSREEGYRELREELGISPEDVNGIDLMGIVAYPHTLETDITYLARLTHSKPLEYFTSGAWKQAVDSKEHRELIVLSTPDDIHRLVEEGKPPQDSRNFEVLASTDFGLRKIAQYWDEL